MFDINHKKRETNIKILTAEQISYFFNKSTTYKRLYPIIEEMEIHNFFFKIQSVKDQRALLVPIVLEI
jgi:hypothetical protein